MDILYVVGTGSHWNNNELKYSLRSIAKYGKNVDNVIIVGNKPSFVSDKVIYIPCSDTGNCKHTKILNKVIAAIKSGKLSKHFLISSDDHFYVKEVDFNNIPVYYKRETIEPKGGILYRKSLMETKDFLIKNELTTFQTNPHCNTHFDVDIYNKYMNLFTEGKKLPHGCELNCLMGNLLIKEGWESKKYRDVKVKRFATRKGLLDKIGDSECFSIYDEAIDCGVGKYLEELFPEKCKYEK